MGCITITIRVKIRRRETKISNLGKVIYRLDQNPKEWFDKFYKTYLRAVKPKPIDSSEGSSKANWMHNCSNSNTAPNKQFFTDNTNLQISMVFMVMSVI
ncbi:hypothetical protein HPP92_015549 [Vanilla planifolia]|uniref:Uncharacterized protein n=1 Tax=Vanilla planifolia TaxID=51239 RepID=A0A835UTS7_VANPL|nr:hypothetical protein HPP92_015549 [Vanilla planifolia]